jgi:hypothetical protein
MVLIGVTVLRRAGAWAGTGVWAFGVDGRGLEIGCGGRWIDV